MALVAGDEIHYIALLDRELNTRQVIPVETPIIVPDDTRIVGVNATVRMTLDIEERACWTDDIP
jgi:hypothetical protein